MSQSVYRVHTSITSTAAIKAVGEVQITKKWNETAKQTAKERSVLIPMECVKAPEVPESFRALVESALNSQAVEVLKDFCDANPNSYEIDASSFNRDALVEGFLSRGDSWLSKAELETGFTASATWKRISSDPRFESNQAYKNAATAFKETILKLTGKSVSFEVAKCDAILSKLEESDFETPFGAFVVKRLNSIRAKSDDLDLSALG